MGCRCVVLFVAALSVCSLCSCSTKREYGKETFPVTGELYVDGQPAAQVLVKFHDVNGMDKQNPTESSTFTDEAGKFALSTFEAGDGVPAGDYIATFMWGQLNPLSNQYGGPDKLKNKYVDPKKSEFKVKVEPGQPTDMGRIELTTK